MCKIELEMKAAVANRRNWKSGNTEVVADSNTAKVYLHGNHIATINGNNVEVNMDTVRRWPTNTTLARLRALGVSVRRAGGVVQFEE